MNGLDAEHEISFNDKKYCIQWFWQLSICLSENDSQSERNDLKELKDDLKFTEKIDFLAYRACSVQSELKDSNGQTTFKRKIDDGWKKMPKMKKQEFICDTAVNNKQ